MRLSSWATRQAACAIHVGTTLSDDNEKYHRADAILDVEAISRYGRRLGDNITEITFPGGLHDLALSRKEIRTEMYHTMLNWLRDHNL